MTNIACLMKLVVRVYENQIIKNKEFEITNKDYRNLLNFLVISQNPT